MILEKDNTISTNNSQNIVKPEDNNEMYSLQILLSTIINDSISDIYILYEINYFTNLKKRYFVFNDEYFYKLRFDRIRKQFNIRIKIPLTNIFKIEKTIISNTTEFIDKELVIIYYEYNNEIHKILLVSLNNNINYNINGLFSHLKDTFNNNNIRCNFIINDKYEIDIGYGISEAIVHNKYFKMFKNEMVQKLIYTHSFFDK